MAEEPKDMLRQKLGGLEQMPSIPVALAPLLRCLEQPLDRVEVQEVVDLISQDKSLAAQCLHMANSPLFGRFQPADSIRSAVLALGLQRMRDIAISCSVLKLSPGSQSCLDPTIFWEHSMGCALLSRRLAKHIGFANPEKAYLAGLLHDLGILVNLWILPKEFSAAFELARAQGIPLHEAELSTMGFTHGDSGRMLAEQWKLPPDLIEVIGSHHDVKEGTAHSGLLALISISDLLCRMSGLGHGTVEERQVDILDQPAFAVLLKECPSLQTLDWALLTFELEGYIGEVHRVVSLLYRPQ